VKYKLEKNPNARLRRIEVVSKLDRDYVASRKQSGSGDWTYEIAEVTAGHEANAIATVVIDRPTQIIDSKAHEAEVLQAIGNAIDEHERKMVRTLSA
jgi:ribosome-associated translation inhibitor RaiA